jgi:L-amino acid N-acyltransferase
MRGALAIRDAQPSDAPAIAAIYNQTVAAHDATMDTEPKSDAQIARQIAELGAREAMLVQTRDSRVLGFGRVMAYSSREGYRATCETAVYLDRGLRRQGLGTLLKRAVIERAARLGYHHLVAKVLSSNAASIAYNLALGYEIVGTQREAGRLDGRWVDVTIMQLVLPGALG